MDEDALDRLGFHVSCLLLGIGKSVCILVVITFMLSKETNLLADREVK
jgi:hypothetical protein